jgi:hypothetical protein
MSTAMFKKLHRPWALALSTLVLVVALTFGTASIGRSQGASASFEMVRSTAAENAGCLEGAKAQVSIVSLGFAEKMRVRVSGLPPRTTFNLFVIQVPDAPFGLSWYQGDFDTNGRGRASKTFIGRFNDETFVVAPGVAPAPVVHDTDAAENPATAPVHTFHLGLWFNSPEDAAAAGCPDTVTPFNGDHTAGIQALSTRNFPPDQGPLRQIGS